MRAKPVFTMGFLSIVTATGLFAADAHTTAEFEGVNAYTGMAMPGRQDSNDTLTWSEEFKIPDTPAPHWQVVDTKGNVYLLQRLVIKDDKQNRTIPLPSYVHDVAEVLLGEASFSKPILTASGERMHSDSMAMSR